MSHIELITRIRADLGTGNHLDAWELALDSQDAVALAYVAEHAPITMTSDPCGSCHGAGARPWLIPALPPYVSACPFCRPDGLCWETMIFVGDWLVAEFEPGGYPCARSKPLRGVHGTPGVGRAPWARAWLEWVEPADRFTGPIQRRLFCHITELMTQFLGAPSCALIYRLSTGWRL